MRLWPALALVSLLSWTPALRAQARPAPMGGGGSVAATERFVFVVFDGVLYKFDADSLGLMGSVKLGAQAVAAGKPGKPGKQVDVVETVDEPSELVVEEVVAPSRQAIESAVDHAIEWLCARQDEDGRWDSDQFMKHDGAGEACDGPGSPVHDIGDTGLVCLALLADGSNLRSGPRRDELKKAVAWLRGQQQANGLIGTNASHDFIYDHAIATVALSEAYGLSNYKLLQPTVQNAINYLESHRNPYAVWRYQPRDNDNDTCVTTWALYAYTSADFFGLQVNKTALQLGATWYDQVTDETGRVGYSKAGEPSSRKRGDHQTRFPTEKGEAMTAAGLFGRFLLGQDPKEKAIMKAGADLLMAKPPRWAKDSIDPYYWMFGTHAMYQMGGRYWQEWQQHLGAIVDAQRKDGNFAGSWDPVGVWDCDGGRVYSTAMHALTLTVAQRSSRLVRD